MPSVALQLNWIPGVGTPPATRSPDRQKVFVHYRDVRQPQHDFEVQEGVDGAMFYAPDGGKWTFTIKSVCEGEYSNGFARESYVVDGTLVDPGSSTDAIPDGVDDIPRPEGLTITLGA
jgi:hypothetical protein